MIPPATRKTQKTEQKVITIAVAFFLLTEMQTIPETSSLFLTYLIRDSCSYNVSLSCLKLSCFAPISLIS